MAKDPQWQHKARQLRIKRDVLKKEIDKLVKAGSSEKVVGLRRQLKETIEALNKLISENS
jgi:hypothetical protein